MLKIIFTLFTVFFITACSQSEYDKPLKISTTTWIGYTPLFYAKEKGWLAEINVKLIHVLSLSENMYLYKAGNSDAYVGTQYEHSVLKNSMPTLVPIMMFDRSNGGDMVMSNVSLKKLQKSQATIDTYLEMDSINYTMLEDFLKRYKIDEKRINYINRDQAEIATLKKISPKHPAIVVTYIPYNSELEKQGFKQLLSTKESLDILVLDAMFTKVDTLIAHKKQFLALKSYVDKAVLALKKNPKEFFERIKPYLHYLSYEEFASGLNDIEWINKDLPSSLHERMAKTHFSTKDLL